jgi:hypothetical protein
MKIDYETDEINETDENFQGVNAPDQPSVITNDTIEIDKP